MYTANKFKDNLEEITKHLKAISPKCPICKGELGLGYATSMGIICDICYFDDMRRTVETNPVFTPRTPHISNIDLTD